VTSYRSINCLLLLLWITRRAHTEQIDETSIRIRQ
jgi:hypothetical protein